MCIRDRFEGVVAQLQQLYETTESELSRQRIRQYMSRRTCSVCQGARLRPEILAVTIDGVGIHEFSRKPVSEARMFIESLRLTGQQDVITTEIRREIGNRLNFLCEVGLGYLTLDRESGTLSGGEAQRLSLIHISEPTRLLSISYAVFCLKKKKEKY